jgi:hypothetical protein
VTVKGSVRTSQLVTTYGVGAMVAAKNESFLVAGLDRWQFDEEFEFNEPRLERLLGVRRFVRPPSSEDETSRDVPVMQFPRYHSCPTCNRLEDIGYFKAPFGESRCTFCDEESDLVPSRFVIACAKGHLDDFPFYQWVHSDHPHPQGPKAKLTLRTSGQSAGLRDVIIRCSCGARRSMDGAFGKSALRAIKSCQGARPWLGQKHAEGCDQIPVTLQRGASNVWFSRTVSAISIPPWSDAAFKVLNRHWRVLSAIPHVALGPTIAKLGIADEDHSVEDLVTAAHHRKAQEAGELGDEDVKLQEYEALVRGAAEHPDNQFVCLPAADPGRLASAWIPQIQKVTRLREVRVLTGFSRLQPPHGGGGKDGDEASNIVHLPGPEHGWLPAIEVIGEGVFLEFDSDRLRSWEKRPAVVERVQRLAARYKAAGNPDHGVLVVPRFVLLHTLSHALIAQWALDSGYAAAALTERLYVGEGRAGLLIYTATSDSAGSLGGVVAVTDDGRLSTSLEEAVRRASWCSSDPLCIEAATQGVDALNLAACHACSLLPETSCEHRNQLLDRALLVGTPTGDDDPAIGYFAELL